MRTALLTPAAVAATLLLCASVPAGAQARVSCAYAGPPGHVLTVAVSASSSAVIERRGEAIAVSELDEAATPCTGATPTVTNTDTIGVRFSGDQFPSVDVLLQGGPLAPGVTPEAVGASEIEIETTGPGLNIDVVGTPASDVFVWGSGGVNAGLNVNSAVAGDTDVDVTVGGTDPPLLYAEGAAGDDTFTGDGTVTAEQSVFADGGPGKDVVTLPRGGSFGFVDGGSGNDTITGSAFADVLGGDGGDDRIVGRDGNDEISGGAGRDRILSGAGRDVVKVRDGARDNVTCGAGRDRVHTDRRDLVNGCETVRRGR